MLGTGQGVSVFNRLPVFSFLLRYWGRVKAHASAQGNLHGQPLDPFGRQLVKVVRLCNRGRNRAVSGAVSIAWRTCGIKLHAGYVLSRAVPALILLFLYVGVYMMVDPVWGLQTARGASIVFVACILVTLMLWAFMKASLSDPGSVPDEWLEWDGQLETRPEIPLHARLNEEYVQSHYDALVQAAESTRHAKVHVVDNSEILQAKDATPEVVMSRFADGGLMLMADVGEEPEIFRGAQWRTFNAKSSSKSCNSHSHGAHGHSHGAHGHSHGDDHAVNIACDDDEDEDDLPPPLEPLRDSVDPGAPLPLAINGDGVAKFTWGDVQWPLDLKERMSELENQGIKVNLPPSLERKVKTEANKRTNLNSPQMTQRHTDKAQESATTAAPKGPPSVLPMAARDGAKLPTQQLREVEEQMKISMDPYPTNKCKKCDKHRPPRAHHCSACNRCVVRMDHHCVWLNNCVGLYNHKYFLLFVGYTCVSLAYFLAVFAFYISSQGFPDLFSHRGFLLYGTLALGLTFMKMVVELFLYHWRMVSRNVTQLEEMFQPGASLDRHNRFDTYENLLLTCGGPSWTWILPFRFSGPDLLKE